MTGCTCDAEHVARVPDSRVSKPGETFVVVSTKHLRAARDRAGMKRRAVIGMLASLAVAGCTGTGSQSPTVTDTARTTTRSTTQTTTTTNEAPDGTTAPDATPEQLLELGVPATQVDLPLGDEGRAVPYPEHSDASLSLAPDDDVLDLPADSTTFTVENDTGYEYRANFYGWSLEKRVHGRWFHVAPQYWPQPLHVLPPGASHDWTFEVDNTESPSGGPSNDEAVSLSALGGGEYAFTLHGWFPLGDEDDPFEVSLGARFRVDGDQLELTPTDGVSTTRDGDTVTVTLDADPTDDERVARLVAERVGESGVPPNQPVDIYIAEQLLQSDPSRGDRPNPLRNALAGFENGVDEVRYEAPTAEQPAFDIDAPLYLRYGEDHFEVRTESVE